MKNTIFYIAVCFIIQAASCTKVATYADIFEGMEVVIIGENELFADSTSTSIVEVRFDNNLVKDQQVAITTSQGRLFKPPYHPDSNGLSSITLSPFDNVAKAILLANTLDPKETVFVSATVNGFTKFTETSFLPALPDDMQLSATSQQLIATDTKAEITGQLFRNAGFSSNGVRFEVRSNVEIIDTSQVELSWNLPEFVLSFNNKIEVPLTVLQHSPGSQLRIFLSTQDASGALLEKSILIWFE